MTLVLAKWAADRCAAGNMPEWVAAEAINYLESRLNGHGGMILLNSGGHFGIFHNCYHIRWHGRVVGHGRNRHQPQVEFWHRSANPV